MVAKDPDLTAPASRRVRAILEDRWAGRLELARVGYGVNRAGVTQDSLRTYTLCVPYGAVFDQRSEQ